MRKIICITALLSLFAKDVASASWQIWFYLNQAEIAAANCENKDKPQMHCNGKCHLAKELKKMDPKPESDKIPASPFSNMEKMLWAYQEPSCFQFQGVKQEESQKNKFKHRQAKTTACEMDLFRPPQI